MPFDDSQAHVGFKTGLLPRGKNQLDESDSMNLRVVHEEFFVEFSSTQMCLISMSSLTCSMFPGHVQESVPVSAFSPCLLCLD